MKSSCRAYLDRGPIHAEFLCLAEGVIRCVYYDLMSEGSYFYDPRVPSIDASTFSVTEITDLWQIFLIECCGGDLELVVSILYGQIPQESVSNLF